MKHDDAKILQEIQRNTEMGMTAIETILDKIEDDDFSLQLSKQSLRYSEIHNKALDQILENKRGSVSWQPDHGYDAERKHSCKYGPEHQQGTSGRDDDSGKQQRHYQHVEGDET